MVSSYSTAANVKCYQEVKAKQVKYKQLQESLNRAHIYQDNLIAFCNFQISPMTVHKEKAPLNSSIITGSNNTDKSLFLSSSLLFCVQALISGLFRGFVGFFSLLTSVLCSILLAFTDQTALASGYKNVCNQFYNFLALAKGFI